MFRTFIIHVLIAFSFILVFKNGKSTCWNLMAANLPEDVFIWKIAVWRNRAFLAIPRWKIGSRKVFETSPTLYETGWPESNTKFSTVVPFLYKKSVNNQCPRSTTGLAVDNKGRLWVLESPDNFGCWARILIFDLKRNNQLVAFTELTKVPTKDLRALVVDSLGINAYIGDPGDDSIITFSLDERRWRKMKMARGTEIQRVPSTDIAISRKDSTLYMTGSNTLDLYSLDLEELKFEESPFLEEKPENLTVQWHGDKLGSSCGLYCDVRGGLHYFMTSERASVRWDTKLPLKAESHSILLQTENCPCVTDYVMDAQKNLWVLVNLECPFSKRNISGKSEAPLKSRTIKIGKYSLS